MIPTKPQIFQFSDFASYLVAYFDYRQLQHPWFSVRRLTKQSGLGSTAQLSMLMNRRRKPSLPMVERVCQALGLSDDEVCYAVLLAERELDRSVVLRQVIDGEMALIAARNGATVKPLVQAE